MKQLAASIEAHIPNIKLTIKDFARISFSEQVSLTHSAGVFVGMHGAGATHIYHMALGQRHCCAMVELQPDRAQGEKIYHAPAYKNFAHELGIHHYLYLAQNGLTSEEGTRVDVPLLTSIIQEAVNKVRKQSTCLNRVKDTIKPMYKKQQYL
jgi:hypothetical protein